MCIYPWHDAAPRYLLMLVSPVADYLLITIIIIVSRPAHSQLQLPTCRPPASTPSTLWTLDMSSLYRVAKL